MSRPSERLAELGIELPDPPKAAANYVPWVRTGSLVHVAGQIPPRDDDRFRGRLGRDLDVEAGKLAARHCAIALLAQARDACEGNLDRVVRCVKLDGFVASADDFEHQSFVVDGASELMVQVLGEAGRHARACL